MNVPFWSSGNAKSHHTRTARSANERTHAQRRATHRPHTRATCTDHTRHMRRPHSSTSTQKHARTARSANKRTHAQTNKREKNLHTLARARVRARIVPAYIVACFSEARGAEMSAFAPSAPHRMLLCQRLPEFVTRVETLRRSARWCYRMTNTSISC